MREDEGFLAAHGVHGLSVHPGHWMGATEGDRGHIKTGRIGSLKINFLCEEMSAAAGTSSKLAEAAAAT